jgi:hypothetical protein
LINYLENDLGLSCGNTESPFTIEAGKYILIVIFVKNNIKTVRKKPFAVYQDTINYTKVNQ